ncbi:SigE family RNA polymerase sigma factor [Actinophytocola sp.]|uniref:SigE family RNA polymerase sigma factor n=1 Tax=Actinophytocola sp. TaxID=1872138 RepID=UPI002ED5EFDE
MTTGGDDFSAYFAARAHTLRATAYLLCGDWHRAEDITQTAMTKLYLAWPRLRDHGMDAYARKVVVRTFLAENRRLWHRREHLTHEPPEPVSDTGDVTQRLLVEAALATVPPRQRAVLVLRYWNDLSVEDTADVLECSTGTVKSQAARGIAALRKRLGPHFDMLSKDGR